MKKKLINSRTHPKEDLVLKCYTKSAFYQKAWNDDTINARGHVYDSSGNIVSCPFRKIFNMDEHESTKREHLIDLLNDHWNEVIEYKKWNGHLSIMFNYNGKWMNTTKGSFDHDFVDLDRIVIESSGYKSYVMDEFPINWTLMFEIVADYDKHAMTDEHIKEIGDEHAVLIGVNDRYTGETIPDYREKIIDIFDSLEEPHPFIPKGRKVSDDIFIDDLSDEERKETIDEYLDLLMERENTEGTILFIPSLDYRVKLKTPWFLKKRYIHQFNAEKTKKIFFEYEDSEEAFNKIPEELHAAYDEVIDDSLKFYGIYKERLMESFESLCKLYKTRIELIDYINSNIDLSDQEKKAMKCFLTGKGLDGIMKDVFIANYRSFSLVDRL